MHSSSSFHEYCSHQDVNEIKSASNKSKKLLDEIIGQIRPGRSESEVYSKSLEIYQDHGIKKSWHNPYIKFGKNTSLTYSCKKTEDLILAEEDIAFVDIGPIWGQTEGEVGKTIVFGSNKIFWDLKYNSELLFEMGLEFYRAKNPTGIEMQSFINQKAHELGYKNLLESSGHLIGLFSHSAVWNKGIGHFDQAMSPGIWILEIHIKHPNLPYGAFYEDILF
jgi:hypothetical protein